MKYLHKGKLCTVKVLTKDDLPLLMNVAEDVFDNPIDEAFADEFLNDPRHHVVVATAKDKIVGFVSAVHYIHPDKPPELWINEIAVAPPYQRHGLGTAILKEMLQLGKGIGCKNAWVLTDRNNESANLLYQSAGGQVGSDETVMYEFDITK